MLPAIGYALREQNRLILDDPAIDAIEITFERADDPLRIARYLGELDPRYVSIHALKLSPGSADPPPRHYLSALKSIAHENGARSISDHLGFTRAGAGGAELGHFSPLPPTRDALDAVCRNIRHIQHYFDPLDFYVENIASLFRLEGEMSEADFLAEVLHRTGCGWVLDVTNVYANAVNFDFDPREFIRDVMPASRTVQFHLAGGYFDEKSQMYIDSHSRPVPGEVWELYRLGLELAGPKTGAVFIERDQDFPDESGWLEEVRTARQIAEDVCEGVTSHGR